MHARGARDHISLPHSRTKEAITRLLADEATCVTSR